MAFAGRLDAASIGALWRPAMRAAERARGQPLAFDLGAVSFSDVGGASFLAAVEAAHGEAAQPIGAQERVMALLLRARAAGQARAGSETAPRSHRARRHRAGTRAAGRQHRLHRRGSGGGRPAADAAAHAAHARSAALYRSGRRAVAAAGGAARLSDRPDPGVPVGGADAAVRRRHLRRQPGGDQPGARTWPAAGGGDPGRTHRLRLRRRDRHHEGERGGRCPDDDGAGSR